jgi:DNA (cytosine-5)-methyltransferase 1
MRVQGLADFICGGPPCQGVSGYNRFRNTNAPLEDVKNKQLVVYMDIIDFLKPKYVLMENVVDILKFAGGFLGRYAVGRLVAMNYQTRMGMMAAGSYGLPQFRMRVFLWGALPAQVRPLFVILDCYFDVIFMLIFKCFFKWKVNNLYTVVFVEIACVSVANS